MDATVHFFKLILNTEAEFFYQPDEVGLLRHEGMKNWMEKES